MKRSRSASAGVPTPSGRVYLQLMDLIDLNQLELIAAEVAAQLGA